MTWHYGKLLRMMETLVPDDQIAFMEFDTGKKIRHGDFRRHVRNIARYLQDIGVGHGTKVAICARNRVEYLEVVVAILQTGLVHVNLNFRYVADELFEIVDGSDAEVVFFSSEFTDRFESLRDRLSKVKHYFEFTNGENAIFKGAHIYCEASNKDTGVDPIYSEASDDLFMMYTGGTTGLPKGVVWTQSNILEMGGRNFMLKDDPRIPIDEDDYRAMIKNNSGARLFVVSPFMHGMGLYLGLATLLYGGTVVTNTGHFSAEKALDALDQEKIAMINVAGDVMAKPIYEALKNNPDRWDISNLMVMISSAALFSAPIKKGLISLIPNMTIIDMLGGV